MDARIIPVLFVIAIVVATVALGTYASRRSRTASDFYVAGRGVNAVWNSSAISGEYLSVASFLGIAGMVMRFGYDVLWYAVGYAAGYVFLLLFIAGPLRRFGAYTVPDFAEGRLDSTGMRKVAVAFALTISVFYMIPQMKGAGITLARLLGSPYWLGVVIVGTVITLNVILGGMKGVTLVQAMQYWVKQFAIMVPIFVLFAVTGAGYGENVKDAAALGVTAPITTITTDTGAVYPPAGELRFTGDGRVVASKPTGAGFTPAPSAEVPDPVTRRMVLQPGVPFQGSIGDILAFPGGAELVLKAGMTIPNVIHGDDWLLPFGPLTSKYGDEHSVLYTYSLIVALLCGTAGLPHILVRFYTSPNGREAKKTALLVICLLSLFYVFPAMWGVLGRNVMPTLYITGATDLVTILLPEAVLTALGRPLLGQVLTGIMSAGAFAAFMTTFSGLLVSVSGGLAHDVYGRMIRPGAPAESQLTAFRVAAAFAGAAALGLGLLAEPFDVGMLVGWAFAIGASTYFPLLLLGAWYRNLTAAGGAAGMLSGGAGAIGSVLLTMLAERGVVADPAPLLGVLMAQPAIWTVPLALTVMITVSRLTGAAVPADVDLKMLRLHAPEQLGVSADYIPE